MFAAASSALLVSPAVPFADEAREDLVDFIAETRGRPILGPERLTVETERGTQNRPAWPALRAWPRGAALRRPKVRRREAERRRDPRP